ncbi:MAG: sugar phosphate nucleotidyltransferase [bacterium]|nr:sugar phosphate nucleotidyltransferase [bacterium]
MKGTAAIILAAGEGTRLNSGQPSPKPKALYEVAGKPMIHYSLEVVKKLGIEDTVIVIGHLGEQIKEALGDNYKYALQPQATGTGEAVRLGLERVNEKSEKVLVLYGADVYQKSILEVLLAQHLLEKPTISFLTAETENPTGLGRIVRDDQGNLEAIVEEKVATEEQKRIKEVNDGCYLFDRVWLEKSIKNLKLTKANEYFLTDLVELAVAEEAKIVTHKIDTQGWFGVDTPEQLSLTSEFIEKHWSKDEA